MSANDCMRAFPSDTFRVGDLGHSGSTERGMTLRDYFAAKAMMLAAQAEDLAPTCGGDITGGTTYRGIAERCYLMADAMMAAREAKP